MEKAPENRRRGKLLKVTPTGKGKLTGCNRFRGEEGFSLLELIIAISMLAIGLVAAASTLSTGIGSNRMAQRVTVETNLAYSVLDEFLAKDNNDGLFDSDSTGTPAYDLDTGNGATTRVVNGVTYSAVYSITVDSPVPGVALVSVTVTGGGRTVTLSTLKRSI